MKTFSYFSVFFISLSIFAQQPAISLQDYNLKGKVHSIEKKTFIIDKITSKPVQKYNEQALFDKEGKLIELTYYGDDNILDSKIIFSYNGEQLQSETVYNASGKKDKTTSYEYDERGRLTTQKKYNNQGKLQYQISYFYNKEGLLSSSHKLIPSINYTMKEQYSYNPEGNRIETVKKTRIGSTKEIFEYNEQGKQIKKTEYNALGELFSSIKYQYNKYNDKINLKKYDLSGKLNYFEDYLLQYDNNGNWIERISNENGEKVQTEKRIISYY